jgi:hypothetical protein
MNMNSSVYPAVIVACLLGFLGLVLGWLQFSVSIETINPDASLPPETLPPQPQSSSQPCSPIPSVSTPVSKQDDAIKKDTPSVSNSESVERRGGQGGLRMSNQTNQPVRVALLTRRSVATSSSSRQPTYGDPVHWDFAPGEGSRQGLILSLPKGNLKLEKGDILVAFAQDGSRRYWGPYVVGETPVPIWNQKTSEWQLVLQP